MNIIFNYLYSGLKAILFFIDNIVYSFIPILYRLLLYLSSIDLVSDNIPVQALIQRIYILVGVFMLFRLSFSIMNYIINPDAFSDQSKGFTNLVKRVLIALVLLVSIPWLFSKAYEIQATILNSNILPRLVLGEASVDSNTNHDENTLEKTIDTSAKDLQFLMFSPFFSLNYASSVDDNGDPSGDLAICQPTSSAPATHILGTKDMAANEECLNKVAELMDDDPDIAASGTTLRRFFRFKDSASDKILDYRKFSSFGSLIRLSLSDGQPAINYYPIVSTLCGAYLVFLLLSFCIDVAARIIRLLFLQILSPIAVISSIDPTSSGDRLKEWGKECLKVFLSLFLRLLVIFLIIQLVRVISNTIYSNGFKVEGFNNSGGINVWIYVFLIFGVFQAAKNVPDLIEKATGIKMSGELQMNPFKALGENTGFNTLAGAALGGAVGATTGGIAGVMTARSLGHNALLGGLGGVASGTIRGQYGGLKSHDIGKSLDNAKQAGGRISRAQSTRAAIGGWRNIPLMIGERFMHNIGAATSYDIVTNRVARYDAVDESVKALDEVVEGKMGNPLNGDVNAVAYRRAVEEEQQAITQYRNGQIDENTRRERVENARRAQNDAKYNFVDAKVQSGDEEISALRRKVSKTIVDSGLKDVSGKRYTLETAALFGWRDISDRGDSSSVVKRAQAASTTIKSNPNYDDLRDVSDALKGTDRDAHMKH